MEHEDRRSEYRRKAEHIADKESLHTPREKEELIYELKVHQIELEMQNAELQAGRQELHRSRRQFEMLFEYAPIGYFVFNEEAGVAEVNGAGAALLKTDRKYLHRKPFIVFLPREFHAPFFEHVRKVFRSEGTERTELRLLDREGTTRRVRLDSRRQVNPEGKQQCLSAVTEISENRRDDADMGTSREEATEPREEAAGEQEPSPISLEAALYETITPLREVTATLEKLLEETEARTDRRRIVAARDAATTVISSLTELHGEQRYGVKESESSQGTVEPRELLATIETLLRPGYLERNNELRMELDIPEERLYLGDRTALRQLLITLLANANAYTDGGAVTLRLRESSLSEELCELSFAVEDTGRGIEPERHREILQGGAGNDGSGRGLTIARQLARRMGGQLYFESRPDVGTTFYFSLPLRLSDAAGKPAPDGSSQGPKEESGDFSILVAEDNAINVLVLRTVLEREGYRVTAVENGREAIEELQRYPHDLVLMDISMPVLDGLEATAAIRSGEAAVLDPKVPIIAITAHSMKGDRERFLAAGMNHYVSKPFSKEDVVRLVRDVVAGRAE